MNEIVLPSHTNALGTIFGGVVMGWVDIAAAIAAQRYARSNVVTASIDYLNFINPIKTGWTVRVCAQVSYVGKTSMEVEVIVDAEKNQTGERKRATHAYLTFVAVDENGRPTKVTPYVPQTAEEKKAYEAAKIRRERRLQWR
ncbi:MAG: acyl-CoA thioesterase [Bdellovibrionaceae bacterium]|nr:acyl-CoA thioesterase [Bdellovibrionales bacterium]MCB9254905.1 acyl-CoA thioesterase [Pseudobdellovibrionaceae bacterium]